MNKLPLVLCSGTLAFLLAACTPTVEATPRVTPTATVTPAPTVAATPNQTESATPKPSDTAFTFTRENLPRLDGSTSTAPLAEAVCSVLLGESRDEVQDLVLFNKTTTAYYNLLQGNADLLIIGEANEEVLAEKERLGFKWEQEPFATDAFVFVVNEDNPVRSITVDEARRIYTGEITNWKELGGEDRAILPFQRNADAGSQTLMEKLVMQGTPMMEAPTDYVAGTMGQLMEAVKSYDGSPGAIGYSVYYYAEEMRMAKGLKLLALEGVEPGPATIRNGEYPLVNPKYVVIPADAAEDAPNRILFHWLLSEEGQRLVAHEGYVSIREEAGP
ncbi:ABC-type phosphate transport system periplasmic component-like protein (fragment) [uncultured Eubacteriales bacterium]|uniref:ABC-type phosphate transport system periplasmic component-like protein n=1 Tax=uncultured Eubacteriales bacterium TaxID=172733 RepID=A0A212KI87_9FIRM